MASSWVPTLTSQYSLDRVDVSWSVFPKITKLLVDILLNLKARKPYPPGSTCQNFLGSLKNNIIVVGTLHGINHQSLHLQRLAPLMWSLEWMDQLTQWLWSSSYLATLPSHRCTNPVDDFYVLFMQLEAWRNSIATTFKPTAQIIGGVSGRCTVFVTIIIIRNISHRCCDSSSQSHRNHKKKKPKHQIIPRLTRRSQGSA